MPIIPFEDQEIAYTAPTALVTDWRPRHPAPAAGRGDVAPGGTPVVFIHGAGGSALTWPPQIRRARTHPVVAVDLPGHGDARGEGYPEMRTYARAVLAVLDHLKAYRPSHGLASAPPSPGGWTGGRGAVLAGHSMGAAIAMQIALEHADRVAGLVLVGTGARLRVAPQILSGVAERFEKTAGAIVDWSYGPQASDELKALALRQLLQVPPAVLHNDFCACDAFDVMDTIANVDCPTLIICGNADKMTPVKYSQFLAEKIHGARLEIVPGAGHMVMVERPDEVAQMIGEFVVALKAAGSA